MLTNLLRLFGYKRPTVSRLMLVRKDKLTTGYVSEVYVNGKYVCYALDTLPLSDVELHMDKAAFTVDEFTYHHMCGVICLAPDNTIYDDLTAKVYVTLDGSRLPIEC